MHRGVALATAGAATLAYLDQRHLLLHDVGLAVKAFRAGRRALSLARAGGTVVDLFTASLQRWPGKRAVVFLQDGSAAGDAAVVFTFQDLEDYSNRLASVLRGRGLKEGETVALFMENKPEFVGTWLALTKLGCKVALLNTSIKEKGLVHCIKVASCTALIFDDVLGGVVRDVEGQLPLDARERAWNALHLDKELLTPPHVNAKRPFPAPKPVDPQDTWGYIYTSGTTGLPKACNISHFKWLSVGNTATMFEVKPEDVTYTVLPLYHSAGGQIGVGFMLQGSTMVLRRKFTASKFFQDCAEQGVTVVQYIGELARFLLATPPSKFDQAHRVRIAIGNGLRPEVWNEFKQRFNIPEVGEFFGATEANLALINLQRKGVKEGVGCVGRLGTLGVRATGAKICKFDVETETLVRDAEGYCIECRPGELGELLGMIRPGDPISQFRGYTDPEATEKKIARKVLREDPAREFFRTGDLLSRDEHGYFRFGDRIGDTFRWKGENCSTGEVAEVIATFPGVADANVYGVLIPNNQDGRAPCVALTPTAKFEDLDLNKFVAHMNRHLPSYAVPLFVRVMDALPTTETFKHQKVKLRDEGIDLDKVKEPLYVLEGGTYVRLTREKAVTRGWVGGSKARL